MHCNVTEELENLKVVSPVSMAFVLFLYTFK